MLAREQSTGSLDGAWVSGTHQQLEKSAAKDGELFVYLSSDWADQPFASLKPNKNLRAWGIPLHVRILEDSTMCTAFVVMRGAQCAPWHGNLVENVIEELWKITPASLSSREVEGSGIVDYINIVWAVDATPRLYRQVSAPHGLCDIPSVVTDGAKWDAFWWIYLRNNPTPTYSHVGLDIAATLNKQAPVADALKRAIELAEREPPKAQGARTKHCIVS